MAKNKNQIIAKAIRLIWESLESHLDPSFLKPEKLDKKRGETCKWHQKCVKDYVELLRLISELY